MKTCCPASIELDSTVGSFEKKQSLSPAMATALMPSFLARVLPAQLVIVQ